mmetsp:Transcript_28000/g.50066  ORF Transcript_28000/g.50066 Transcript_28000/m.50066 type:complete len:154 (-) Transcript_28000:188-649(-)
MAPKTAPKAAPAHPPYATMIAETIKSLGERSGSSLYAITKAMGEKYKLPDNYKKMLSVQLKRQVDSGKLVKVKASFKLSDEAKLALKKASKPAAVKKPAVKKTTVKKTTVKKTPVKKAAVPKAKAGVTKKVKKTPVKKTPAKKAATKKAAPKK